LKTDNMTYETEQGQQGNMISLGQHCP